MPQLAISAAKVVVIGLLAAYGLAVLLEALATWTLADMDAYWNAAVRLRHGEALFPLVANEWAPDTYRYAPWFAVAWIPLTYLPKALVEVCWGSLLVASVGASIWPLARRRSMASVALAVLLGAHLLAIASGGNVHPLVVAALVHGVNRRSAPLWIALAASLKAFPAVYLLVFAVRGEWRKAIGGVAVFAALVLPLALVDLKAFNGPIQKALDAGIPVVGYNADAADSGRLAYIGQDLFVSGQEMGKHILELVPQGDVALFIATPGSLNIQPRIDGAIDSIKKSGKPVTSHTVATGAALPKELSTIDAYWLGHKETKGLFAVDAGSTQSLAQVIKKYNLRDKDVKGGGYDLLGPTTQLLAADQIDFTIDQQPYLQGFLPVLQLFMYKASETLTGLADVNTGLKFLDKQTVAPYNDSKSRFEGTSSKAAVVAA